MLTLEMTYEDCQRLLVLLAEMATDETLLNEVKRQIIRQQAAEYRALKETIDEFKR